MRRPIALVFVAALGWEALTASSCATDGGPKPVTTVTKNVVVTVPCKIDPGPEPVYADTDEALKAAPDLFTRVKLLVAGRLQRIHRDSELHSAITACQ